MLKKILLLWLLFVTFSEFSQGLEYNKPHRSDITDFLTHETGGNAWDLKPTNLQQQHQYSQQTSGKGDYVAEFPALRPKGPLVPTSSQATIIHSNKATQSQSGKRDYVAEFPALKPHNPPPSTQTTTGHSENKNAQTSSGKRDYVAPQRPTVKTPDSQQGHGKVKDLINFYDGKAKDQNTPQGMPTYSSIAHLSAGNKPITIHGLSGTSTTKIPQSPSKPTSTFSSVLSGSHDKKYPSIPEKSITTTKVANVATTPKSPTNARPANSPGGQVLPSTIVNNNKNNNQGTIGNGPTDAEIQTLSEELLRKDTNNAAKYVSVNYQGKTTSFSKNDEAPEPLLTISSAAWNIPTIKKFLPLLDNYERDTSVNEYVTPQERIEENDFMDAIMSTTVIRSLMTFLKDKGYVSSDPRQQRDFLKQMWFGLYSRGKGKIGSSGFEHIFLSEIKNGDIQGLHNWIYFSREESANRVNYLGYMKHEDLDNKGKIIKFHFTQQGVDKPVNSMFIGTSPELEMALYTLCFVTRIDNDCKLKLGNKDVVIKAFNYRYRSKNYIGSAFPGI